MPIARSAPEWRFTIVVQNLEIDIAPCSSSLTSTSCPSLETHWSGDIRLLSGLSGLFKAFTPALSTIYPVILPWPLPTGKS